jgi:hypothetical protein
MQVMNSRRQNWNRWEYIRLNRELLGSGFLRDFSMAIVARTEKQVHVLSAVILLESITGSLRHYLFEGIAGTDKPYSVDAQ